MLTGRVTLASVHLCFVCLLALTANPPARICSHDIIIQVQYLMTRSDLTCLDCRLYTPTIQDYLQKCPSSTMKCFADEIEVLIQEWETIPHFGFRLNIKLGNLAKMLNQTLMESECFRCELSKEQKAEKFLKDLCSTLEAMNSSQLCSSSSQQGFKETS